MDGIRNGGENAAAALPLAGGESQFMQDLHRNLPSKLYRVGFATSATAVGGLVEQLVTAASSSRSPQAEADVPVPLSQLPLFLLLVTLFGALGTIYAGRHLLAGAEPASPSTSCACCCWSRRRASWDPTTASSPSSTS